MIVYVLQSDVNTLMQNERYKTDEYGGVRSTDRWWWSKASFRFVPFTLHFHNGSQGFEHTLWLQGSNGVHFNYIMQVETVSLRHYLNWALWGRHKMKHSQVYSSTVSLSWCLFRPELELWFCSDQKLSREKRITSHCTAANGRFRAGEKQSSKFV